MSEFELCFKHPSTHPDLMPILICSHWLTCIQRENTNAEKPSGYSAVSNKELNTIRKIHCSRVNSINFSCAKDERYNTLQNVLVNVGLTHLRSHWLIQSLSRRFCSFSVVSHWFRLISHFHWSYFLQADSCFAALTWVSLKMTVVQRILPQFEWLTITLTASRLSRSVSWISP